MKSRVTVTVLVDDHGTDPAMGTEHGWSVWIETSGFHVLFDTGQTDLLLANAEALGIDLAETDAIVLSHGHYDHTGGLTAVLKMAPEAKVFLHPEATEEKFNCTDTNVRPIGMPEHVRQALKGRHITWTAAPAMLCPGLSVTGQVPRHCPWETPETDFYLDPSRDRRDPLVDDQSLWIETEQGVSVVLGCAHAGVTNTLGYIAGLTQTTSFDTVLGGMHLLRASAEQINRTEHALKEYDLDCVAPGHCTGEPFIQRLKHTLGDRFVPCRVGTQIFL